MVTTSIYPEGFVEEIKKLFPNWVSMHTALDNNGYDAVCRGLEDSARTLMAAYSPEKIITLFESGKQEEILESAKKANNYYELIKKLRDCMGK